MDLVVALTAEVVREHLGLGRDPVLDERARREFRARVGALDEEIAEAEGDHDEARATRARAERDAVLAQLSVATGAGGRWRGLGDPRERARKAVAARIQDALRRVEAVHPPLAAHLHASVRTGSTCEYRPDRPVVWHL